MLDVIDGGIGINDPIKIEFYEEELLAKLNGGKRLGPTEILEKISSRENEKLRKRLDYVLSYKPIPSRISTSISIKKLSVAMKVWGILLAHTHYWVGIVFVLLLSFILISKPKF